MRLLASLFCLILICAACSHPPKAKKDEAYINTAAVVMLIPDAKKVEDYGSRFSPDSLQNTIAQNAAIGKTIQQLAKKRGINIIKDSTHLSFNFIKADNDTVQIRRNYIDNPWPVIFFSPDKNPLIIGRETPERAFSLYF